MSARFAVGDRVRIDDRDPAVHNRTPHYVRGAVGVVERVCGEYGEPERLAYGERDAPARRLYRVRLPQDALWPDADGRADGTLDVEVFEHWLEPAEEA